ncbi:hypothetical protein PUP68_23400 [Pseudomonas chlororaphis]|uniref:hypothetical protein n=1 Tax=Pseudomonas chlororaphis TaxID=587753 RepID=UPI0006A5E6B5|nr:hypothetical protein [Pseudomonas chlororaphis]WDG76985.1 hypothetical protein PUP77_21460 [Pseudomonas chlororaphis]WDG83775.1 hypothetical protein PUP68_23400 [Pseudomonas chlororaphis]WDG90098.1 hypothetical protein PUP49_22815 [Pseudomonas chlororaphis]
MVPLSTNVKKSKTRYVRRVLLLLLLAPVAFWYVATPTVSVYYSQDGKEELRYVWNTQHRIYRGGIHPGESTGDNGFIFPDDEFFMMFYWRSKTGRDHCVGITPKWPNTKIYLDLNGNIDTSEGSGTDTERLGQCKHDRAKP